MLMVFVVVAFAVISIWYVHFWAFATSPKWNIYAEPNLKTVVSLLVQSNCRQIPIAFPSFRHYAQNFSTPTNPMYRNTLAIFVFSPYLWCRFTRLVHSFFFGPLSCFSALPILVDDHFFFSFFKWCWWFVFLFLISLFEFSLENCVVVLALSHCLAEYTFLVRENRIYFVYVYHKLFHAFLLDLVRGLDIYSHRVHRGQFEWNNWHIKDKLQVFFMNRSFTSV